MSAPINKNTFNFEFTNRPKNESTQEETVPQEPAPPFSLKNPHKTYQSPLLSRLPSPFERLPYIKNFDEALKKSLISRTANSFHSAIAKQKDLTLLFDKTILKIENFCKNQAIEWGKPEAYYGIRRLQTEQPWTITVLNSVHNDPLLSTLQNHLKTIPHDLNNYHETKKTIWEESYANRQFFTEIQILTSETKESWMFFNTTENCKKIYSIFSTLPHKENPNMYDVCKLFSKNESILKIKNNNNKDFIKLKNFTIISNIKEFFLIRKTVDWVIAKTCFKSGNQTYTLSEQYTWLYRDHKKDPIDLMGKKTRITVINCDPILTNSILQDTAKIFKSALEWNGEDVNTLKDSLALMKYQFIQARPFVKGNSKIFKLLEESIYHFHKLEVNYKQEINEKVKALSTPTKKFFEHYHTATQLKTIDSTL